VWKPESDAAFGLLESFKSETISLWPHPNRLQRARCLSVPGVLQPILAVGNWNVFQPPASTHPIRIHALVETWSKAEDLVLLTHHRYCTRENTDANTFGRGHFPDSGPKPEIPACESPTDRAQSTFIEYGLSSFVREMSSRRRVYPRCVNVRSRLVGNLFRKPDAPRAHNDRSTSSSHWTKLDLFGLCTLFSSKRLYPIAGLYA